MSAIIKSKQKVKPLLTSSQKNFKRLIKKIEALRSELQFTQEELDRLLYFYYQSIEPNKKVLKNILTALVKILYRHYKNSKSFSKKEVKILKEMLLATFDKLFDIHDTLNEDSELLVILKDVEGVDYDENASKELDKLKEYLKDKFKEMGADADFSDLGLFDSEYDIMQKVAEAMIQAKFKSDKEQLSKPKSKKAIERETKEQKLESLQKQGLNTIYKQLAKVFHPDLEQNIELKSEKIELMKKLTSAYENKDLHTLLLLEIEWLNQADTRNKEQNDEQLKIYNSILKEQVNSLQAEIQASIIHPKYLPIRQYFEDINDQPMLRLYQAHMEITNELEFFEDVLNQLQGEDDLKSIRTVIKTCWS